MLFAFRELLNARKPTSSPRSSPPSTARCSPTPLGEVARGLEVVEFACGIPHLLKGGFTENVSTSVDVHSIRQPLGVVGDHQPVQLPGHGADVVLPDRHRLRQHGGAQAEREGPVGRAVAGRAVERGRAARRRVQRRARRQGGRRRPAHPPGRQGASRSSAPPRSPATSTRPAPRTASACRPSAGRRTTWSCCPTPTSTSPPTRRSTPGSARPASGAWPSPRWSRSATSPTTSSTGSPSGPRGLRTGDGRRGCDMGPLVTAAHRDRVAGYIDAGEAAGADLVVDGRKVEPDADGDGLLARPDPVRPRRHRHVASTPTRSSGRCCRSSGSTPTTRPRAGQRQPVRQRHRDLHQRRRRGPPVPERGRGRHGRHQRADPGADGLLLASAAGRTRCSATPTPTAPRACTSSPAARSSPPAGSTRATAASTSASRRTPDRT